MQVGGRGGLNCQLPYSKNEEENANLDQKEKKPLNMILEKFDAKEKYQQR